MTQQRIAITAALHANSNFSGDKGKTALGEAIRQTRDHFDSAITNLYLTPEEMKEDEIDWDDPFFAAVRRAHDRMAGAKQTPIDGRLIGVHTDERTVNDDKIEFDQG